MSSHRKKHDAGSRNLDPQNEPQRENAPAKPSRPLTESDETERPIVRPPRRRPPPLIEPKPRPRR